VSRKPAAPKRSTRTATAISATVQPLSLEEIALYKQLPSLTVEQIGRILQKTPKQVQEMTRARAARPLPVFRSGRTLSSTYEKIQQWIDEGFKERAAA
jgi:hypothetical protein